jgi:hypothetical protein
VITRTFPPTPEFFSEMLNATSLVWRPCTKRPQVCLFARKYPFTRSLNIAELAAPTVQALEQSKPVKTSLGVIKHFRSQFSGKPSLETTPHDFLLFFP